MHADPHLGDEVARLAGLSSSSAWTSIPHSTASAGLSKRASMPVALRPDLAAAALRERGAHDASDVREHAMPLVVAEPFVVRRGVGDVAEHHRDPPARRAPMRRSGGLSAPALPPGSTARATAHPPLVRLVDRGDGLLRDLLRARGAPGARFRRRRRAAAAEQRRSGRRSRHGRRASRPHAEDRPHRPEAESPSPSSDRARHGLELVHRAAGR